MSTRSDILARFLDTTCYDRQLHPYRRPAEYRKYIADLERLFALVVTSEIHNEAKNPYVTLFPEEWGARQPECRLLFVDSPHQFKLVVRRDRRYHPYRRPRKYFRRRRIHGHRVLADDRLKTCVVPELGIKPPTAEPSADSVTNHSVENDKNQLKTKHADHRPTTKNTDKETKCKEQTPSEENQIECQNDAVVINKPNNSIATQDNNKGVPHSCSSQVDITHILKEIDEVSEETSVEPVPTNSILTSAGIDSETKIDVNNNEPSQPPSKSSLQSSEHADSTKQKDKVANLELSIVSVTTNSEAGSHKGTAVKASSTNKGPCPIVISPTTVSNFEVMLNKGINNEQKITEAPKSTYKDKPIGKQRCRRRWRTPGCHEARPKFVSGTDQNQDIPNKAPRTTGYINCDTRTYSSHLATPDDDPILARLKLIRAQCLTRRNFIKED